MLSCVAHSAVAAENWFPVRTHNPFLQIYGLPLFQGAEVLAPSKWAWQSTLDIANHADDASDGGETVTLDGESYYLNVSLRRGFANWLELGVDIPLTAHADGMLDNAIEDWHDLWGMSNAKRLGPPNELEFHYAGAGVEPYTLDSGAAGLGDIRLHAAVPVRFSALGAGDALSVRAGVKLPTGDPDELLGSGAVDTFVAVYYSGASVFRRRPPRPVGARRRPKDWRQRFVCRDPGEHGAIRRLCGGLAFHGAPAREGGHVRAG